MEEKAPVAVIVVNWNARDVTLDCLSSLRKVTFRQRTTLLVDNASGDGSADAIRQAFPEVTVLRMNENLRFAGGNNRGISHALDAGASRILLLNNDTIVDPEFLGHLVERMDSDGRIGMVSPKIYYHDHPDTIWFAGGRIRPWLGTMEHRGIRETDHGQFDAAEETDYGTGCCLLVRSDLIRAIGGLDESFYMYAEDADWCERARRAGYRIMFEPKAKVWHRVSYSAGGNLSWFKLRNKFFSQMKFFGRYAAWYQWPVFPWLSMVLSFGKLVGHLAAGTSRRI